MTTTSFSTTTTISSTTTYMSTTTYVELGFIEELIKIGFLAGAAILVYNLVCYD